LQNFRRTKISKEKQEEIEDKDFGVLIRLLFHPVRPTGRLFGDFGSSFKFCNTSQRLAEHHPAEGGPAKLANHSLEKSRQAVSVFVFCLSPDLLQRLVCSGLQPGGVHR
jgi:hypothetical protein